jgi:hypothetical protein
MEGIGYVACFSFFTYEANLSSQVEGKSTEASFKIWFRIGHVRIFSGTSARTA